MKRIFSSIIRNLGKSISLLVVILILGNVMSGSMAIQQATNNAQAVIKEKLGPTATITIDGAKLDEMIEQNVDVSMEVITLDLMKQVGESDYVKYYDYNALEHLVSNEITLYHGEDLIDNYEYVMGFLLKGVNHAPIVDIEVEEGKLVDGRVFTQDEIDNGATVTVISKKVADKNNLAVGDTFTLVNEVYGYDEVKEMDVLYDSQDLPLEIIGIFEPNISGEYLEELSPDHEFFPANIEYNNTMYVPNDVVAAESRFYYEVNGRYNEDFVAALEASDGDVSNYSPIYVLNNLDEHEAFSEDVTPLLPDYYKISSAMDNYEKISGPIDSMSRLSKYVLYISVGAMILVVSLIVSMFIRNRRHELGTYVSSGEKKGRVTAQVLLETIIIAIIGITIALFSGNMIAEQVSKSALQDVEIKDASSDYAHYGEIITELTTEDVLNAYEIKLDSTFMLTFYGVGLLTIVISMIVPFIYMIRLHPRESSK